MHMTTQLLKGVLVLVCLLMNAPVWAQTFTQKIKGTVTDRQTGIPLVGAHIELVKATDHLGAYTDENGRFELAAPTGYQELRISYLGYDVSTLPNLQVIAGKETVLDVAMDESVVNIKEVVVSSRKDRFEPINEIATVSNQVLAINEVTRFSGSRNDVSRMAANFAGVMILDHRRNDLVIRGNAPSGVLYRFEGVPVANPNHFSTLGTTGGPVSAINPNLLKNSDFLTGAFPAEYGNSYAGVMDFGFRSGNKDRFETNLQMSMWSGLEATVEGPMLQKNGGSFILGFRNSLTQIGEALKLTFGFPVPKYRDLSFKLDFGNSKLGHFEAFGIGGSALIFVPSTTDVNWTATSHLGVLGINHRLLLSKNGYLKTTLSYNGAKNRYFEQYPNNTEKPLRFDNTDMDQRLVFSSYYHQKLNKNQNLRIGVLAENFHLNAYSQGFEDEINQVVKYRDFKGAFTLLQAYAQTQYKLSKQLSLAGGLHFQTLTFNGVSALEPRVSIDWKPLPKHQFSFGYGLHNQMQPLPIYFYETPVGKPAVNVRTNQNLKFTQSNHLVFGYTFRPADDWLIKTNLYYQFISQAPIQQRPTFFSMLNAGADFSFPFVDSLVNKGKGKNKGIELTVEKSFSKNYYGLLSVSLFDAQYLASDAVWRSNTFNNRHIVNLLLGKEFAVSKKKTLTLDTKIAFAGGRPYVPILLNASKAANQVVYDYKNAYSVHYPAFFKWDFKIGYRFNSDQRKFSQQFFFDFQNITFHRNIFRQYYSSTNKKIETVYQPGFLPDFMWRIQF